MIPVAKCQVPEGSLLSGFLHDGAYVDCYMTEISNPVSQARYVAAFYTTPLFRLERFILRAAAMPSTDAEAGELAQGERDIFAAWHVEARREHEILLAAGRTRSWLMTVQTPCHAGAGTRLYFGSAVLPVRDERTGRSRLGLGFEALLGFHKLYSRALLYAARSRLGREG